MAGSGQAVKQALLKEFERYDKYVDVVSAFEWLCRHTQQIAPTVRHFERFPRLKLPDGTEVTPDFTLVLDDDTGIVGEISSLALHDNSVEKACSQIGKYAEVRALPVDDSGTTVKVSRVDVLLLVPNEVGLAAVQRIIRDRFLEKKHAYKPKGRPTIAQFSRSDGAESTNYTFQHIPDPDNGSLPGMDDPATVGHFLSKICNVPADKFKGVKAQRKFMNDPVPDLYLATHLWTATWPTEHGSSTDDIDVTPANVASTLREQFGTVRAGEVKKALQLLARAGVAADNGDGTWTVSRKTLRMKGERDIARIIADKASKGGNPVVQARQSREPKPPESHQDTLF